MAEYNSLQEHKEGHFPNTDHTLLELHRLLALFLASKAFAGLRTHPPGESFDPIYQIQLIEEDEITRLLLALAITARVIDDRDGGVFAWADSNCGDLQPDLSIQDVQVLNLREACNKIIHAKKIRLDMDENWGQSYLKPFIYLYGNLMGKEWKAKLDIVEFSKWYAGLVVGF